MPEILREHWKFLLYAYIAITVVGGMPSPQPTGPTSSWLYKWAFGSLHAVAAGVPRIVYTLFPQYVKFLPGNGMTAPPTADAAKPQDTGGTKQ